MRNVADKGKVIANSILIPEAFIIFIGYQLVIYTIWKKSYDQVFDFNGSYCRHYYSFEDPILAWKMLQ